MPPDTDNSKPTPTPAVSAIRLTPVKSSQIRAIGHDPATNTLAVQFKDFKGGADTTYHYSGFTPEHFKDFQKSASQGSHFHQNIRGKFDYLKIK